MVGFDVLPDQSLQQRRTAATLADAKVLQLLCGFFLKPEPDRERGVSGMSAVVAPDDVSRICTHAVLHSLHIVIGGVARPRSRI